MKSAQNKPSVRKTPGKIQSVPRQPVKVFCRVRPIKNNEEPCVKVTSEKTVSLVLPPEAVSTYRATCYKEIKHTFKHVFDDKATQKDVFDHVALPLVQNLIHGNNGLLFTYGVTGSGKTFTMTGDPQNGGVMPRCLDVIFNSIGSYQAKKFVFKPDRMNGFDIQSDGDALLDRQKELYSVISLKTPKKKDSDTDVLQRTPDDTKIGSIEDDNTYAVFVTYVEVYNNAVYDLLEDIPEDAIRSKQLQSKIVREDASRNMYVHCVTEVEVKSTEQAFEAFYKGQKRKRMAVTTLNSESSRSHSVFTIRLVQTSQSPPLYRSIQYIVCLTLFAGNINNSLMTLRTCLEILRENQLNGANKMVPYRDSKITHLFKNFFDGEGQVKMIVCVNPRIEDYDETVHVMKFAEMTQEVQMTQPAGLKLDFGLTPGRRKANEIFKQALQKMEENSNGRAQNIEVDIGLVYCLGPQFPCLELTDPGLDKLIKDLLSFLELRMNKKNDLLEDWQKRHQDFRNKLIAVERENIMARQDSMSKQAALEQERKKTSALEAKLMSSESTMMSLQHQLQQNEANLIALKQELEEKEMLLHQQMVEKEKLRQKYSDKIAVEKERNTFDTQKRLKEQEIEFKTQMRDQERKLRKVKQILSKDNSATTCTPVHPTRSATTLYQTPVASDKTNSRGLQSQSSKRGPAVSNPRHRRSRSTGDETWLDHRPRNAVELGTVMQPLMKRRKSVTKLTDAKDVANAKTSKYCLMTQEQDSSGELETRLYKADVIPTCGGGAQVVFNDVEMLKQQSPNATPLRKRNASTGDLKDIEAACAVAVEGHKRARH
ncbi:kinesin-like protein KIF23 [Zootermopsis nevadensis]|uniref:kinesin-like protein KIF23 n=1 Tax=Zootermopsis nevadensis TaxID=136037 RepID=UPI000B8E4B32|nr:kinesin-like protein KIF23 [Zootermopsis nevadensis]